MKPSTACPACRFNYRIVRVSQTMCGHSAAVVELLSFDDLQVIHRQPFVIDEHIAESILDWLIGPVEGHIVFPPFGCRETMARQIAEAILHTYQEDTPDDMIEIEVPIKMLSVSDWIMHFWAISDRVLANALVRSDYTINELTELPEEVIFNIRNVGNAQRGKAALEARKRHKRLPDGAHYLLYSMTSGRDGRKPPE